MTRPIASRASTAYFQMHSMTSNNMLTAEPRHDPPCTDDLVIGVEQRTLGIYGRRTLLASRAQVQELHGWLGRWLTEGWPGVRRVEGPTSEDVIEHYRAVMVREQVAADHARIDYARRLDAALALIPAERRTTDLDTVVKAQSELWARLTAERDALESTRVAFVSAMHEIAHATVATADQLRAAAAKASSRHAHPKTKAQPEPAPDAPIYEIVQLDLFAGEAAL